MANKPNILLIMTDTQRCDTLRCMGNEHAISPNIDRLANDGVLFTEGYTASPVCMPARCSIFTGLHTPVHGCIENGIKRYDNLPFFTDYLKEAGYRNILVGKTHFWDAPKSFDVFFNINGEKNIDCDDFYAEHIRKLGYSRVSKHYNKIPQDDFIDAFITDRAIKCMDEALEENQPFFAVCSMLSPHSPLDPPEPWVSLYDDIPLPEINYAEGDIEKLPVHTKKLLGIDGTQNTIREKTPEEIDKARRLYYGLAAYCDHQVGKLINFLDEKGIRENTLVIFTTDHGQQYYDHGFDDKHNYFDETLRVPFIMSMPTVLPSGIKQEFASGLDISASILAAAGVSCPYIQGFDLFTPLANNLEMPRSCAIATLYKSAALVTSGWKMEYYFEEDEGRLYDRKNDPKERANLFNNPDYTEIKNELLAALLSWRGDLSDVGYLINNVSKKPVGPVATRIIRFTEEINGIDAEIRVNAKCKKLA